VRTPLAYSGWMRRHLAQAAAQGRVLIGILRWVYDDTAFAFSTRKAMSLVIVDATLEVAMDKRKVH
jgi:hypothetical protein